MGKKMIVAEPLAWWRGNVCGHVCLCKRETFVSLVKGKEAVEKEVIILLEGVMDGPGRHGRDEFRKEEGCFHK